MRLPTSTVPLRRCWMRHETRGYAVIAVAEYGIEEARTPVDINRVLRREGLLEVYVQDGREQLDPVDLPGICSS